MDYYLANNGQTHGPVAREQLLIEGVGPQTLVWRTGMDQWVAAGALPELAELFPMQPAPLPSAAGFPPPPYAAAGYAAPGYGYPPAYNQAYYPPTNSAPLPAQVLDFDRPPVAAGKLPAWGWVSWVGIALVVAFLAGGGRLLLKNTRLVHSITAHEARQTQENPVMALVGRYTVGTKQLMQSSAQAQAAKQTLESNIYSDADRIHAIIIEGELDEPQFNVTPPSLFEATADQMDNLAQTTGDPTLKQDAILFGKMYRHGPTTLSTAEHDGLLQRHHWFGRLALGSGPGTDRIIALKAARQTLLWMVLLGVLMFVIGLTGLVLGIIVLVRRDRLGRGYRQSVWGSPQNPVETSQPYGSRYLEAFALYLGAMVVLLVGAELLFEHAPLILSGTVALLAGAMVALWPHLSGERGAAIRRALGWHKGRGVLREMGAGIVGYLAGLPIFLFGIIITVIISTAAASHGSAASTQLDAPGGHPPMMHPIVNYFSGGPFTILAVFFVACICAPLAEETAFRGAFYHHMRQRHGVLISALVVGLAFAAIHPQGWMAIPALCSMAVVFALIREWRGSIIASMTAHALNNFMAVMAMVLLLR